MVIYRACGARRAVGGSGGSKATLSPSLLALGLHFVTVGMGGFGCLEDLRVERMVRANADAISFEVVGHAV
jgi:hypothetical protein